METYENDPYTVSFDAVMKYLMGKISVLSLKKRGVILSEKL